MDRLSHTDTYYIDYQSLRWSGLRKKNQRPNTEQDYFKNALTLRWLKTIQRPHPSFFKIYSQNAEVVGIHNKQTKWRNMLRWAKQFNSNFCTNLLVRVKLGYPPNFNFLGKPLLVEKYVEGRNKERKRRRISRSPEGVLTYP